MIKVGYVDDSSTLIEDYRTRFTRRGIDLLFCDTCEDMDDIVEWIVHNDIKCIMVDHRLESKYNFSGTELVARINSVMPDLQCIIVTSYPNESIGTKLVSKNLIRDRSKLDSPSTDFEDFCMEIKDAAAIFDKRKAMHLSEYEILLAKRQKMIVAPDDTAFDSDDEERFLYLYKLLKTYGELDDIPTELLKPEAEQRMSSILDKLNKLLEDVEGRK